MALPDLTGQNIQYTYQRVIQTDGSLLYNGTGSLITILHTTASHAVSASYAVSASHEIIKEVSSSFADTASFVNPLNQDVFITGSLDVNGSGNFTDGLIVTGSLSGTNLYLPDKLDTNSNRIAGWHIIEQNFIYVGGQEANPTGIFFNPDGDRLFYCGYSTNRIYQYNLSTPWDLLSAVDSGLSSPLNISGVGGTIEDIYISPDGLNLYAISRSNDTLGQYLLASAWDLTSVSFVRLLAIGSYDAEPTAVYFKDDGTILYLVGSSTDDIYQIELGTPWDISTVGTFSSFSLNEFGIGIPEGIEFNADGTSLYIVGSSTDRITEFHLSTPWDITTATLGGYSPYYGGLAATITSLFYDSTSNKAYIIGRSSDRIYQLNTEIPTEFKNPVIFDKSITVDNNVEVREMATFRGLSEFNNTANFRSTFTTYSTTRFNYTTGGTTEIGNTTYGDLNFRFARNNYYPNTLTSTGATFDIIRNQFGGKGRLRIGIPGINNESYFAGTRGIGGTTHITSDADTFDHFGSFTLGGELQVSGSSREVFLTKQEDLYLTLTPIVLDTFTEASDTDIELHTPDTGSGYSLEYSSSGVAPDDLPIVSAGNGWMQPERDEDNKGYIYTNDTVPSIADYEVRATIRRQQSSDDTFWIFFRYVDEDNFYGLQIANNTSYTAIWKKVGGTSTQLSYLNYYVNTSTSDGINIDVAIRGIGDKITIFYEGEYRGTWIDSDITAAGKAGFGFGSILQDQQTSQEIDDNWRISEFRVTEFPSSVFSSDDSIHYINKGNVGIGTTTPTSKLHVSGSLLVEAGTDTPYIKGSQLRISSQTNGAFGTLRLGSVNDIIGDVGNYQFKNGSTTLMTIKNTGNVGIGTTTPNAKLDVQGQLVYLGNGGSGTDRALFIANSINNTFEFNNNAGDRGVRIVTNNGTVGGAAGSKIYGAAGGITLEGANGQGNLSLTTDGKVGIGTTTPSYKLDVNGSGNFTDGLDVTGSLTANGLVHTLATTTGANGFKFQSNQIKPIINGFISLDRTSNRYFVFSDDEGSRQYLRIDSLSSVDEANITFNEGQMYISSSGNVGIGTTTPSYKLDVHGSTSSDIVSSQIGYNIDLLDNPPAIDSYTLSSGTSLSVGTYHYRVVYVTNIGETGAGGNLSVTTTAGNTTVNLSGIPTSSDARVTARKLYRTKVGATSDNQYFLATINDNTTTTYVDNTPDSSLTGANLQFYKVNTTSKFISTNDTQALILDNNLTALGLDAGRDLIANNSAAVRTVLIGKSAGQSLTTGASNVIVGQAGSNLTTGGSNTIIGDLALLVGSSNKSTVIIGSQTARYITSGNNSVIIGASSVRDLVGGGNVTNTSNGVYLGASIKANTDSETNAIAIGYAVDSLGSNTAVIGNDSITTTALKGNVGIGTTTPTAKLHVSGTVQFDDILSVTPQDPLPSGVPMGSFAVSSSVPPKPYFYDGTNWNALY